MYCERCKRLFDGTVCPECGKDRWSREPRADDPCFLMERGAPWDGMLADMLDQHGIAHLTRSRFGAAIGMRAPLLDSSRIYVRFDELEEAMGLAEELFGPDAPR